MQEVMRLCYNLSKSPRLDIVAEIDDGTSLAKLMQYLKTAKAGDTSHRNGDELKIEKLSYG